MDEKAAIRASGKSCVCFGDILHFCGTSAEETWRVAFGLVSVAAREGSGVLDHSDQCVGEF